LLFIALTALRRQSSARGQLVKTKNISCLLHARGHRRQCYTLARRAANEAARATARAAFSQRSAVLQ